MKAALITPFLSHLPLHPSSYLGYGAAVLEEMFDLDILDLNAHIYFKNRDSFREILSKMDNKQVVLDRRDLHPFYDQLHNGLDNDLKQVKENQPCKLRQKDIENVLTRLFEMVITHA